MRAPIPLVLAIATMPSAALATQLDVKTGLWEMTSQMQVQGLVIPPETLARMPPDMRDKMTAVMQGLKQPHTHKSCLTQEKLEKGFEIDAKTKGRCHRDVETITPNELEFRATCKYEDHQSDMQAHFTASDRETMAGKVDIKRTGGKGPSEVHVQIEGKWLGADCGDTKD
jgi:hypothetical protein